MLSKDAGLTIVFKDVISSREILAAFLTDLLSSPKTLRVIVPYAFIEKLFPSDQLRDDAFNHVVRDYKGLGDWAKDLGYHVDYVPESAGVRMRPLQFTRL